MSGYDGESSVFVAVTERQRMTILAALYAYQLIQTGEIDHVDYDLLNDVITAGGACKALNPSEVGRLMQSIDQGDVVFNAENIVAQIGELAQIKEQRIKTTLLQTAAPSKRR